MLRSKLDLEATSGEERLEDVSHDVDLDFFVLLDLLPHDGVIEQMEVVCSELAHRFQRLTLTDEVDQRSRCHRDVARWRK